MELAQARPNYAITLHIPSSQGQPYLWLCSCSFHYRLEVPEQALGGIILGSGASFSERRNYMYIVNAEIFQLLLQTYHKVLFLTISLNKKLILPSFYQVKLSGK